MVPPPLPLYVTIILDSVAEVYHLSEKDLRAGKTDRQISEARRITASLLAESGFSRGYIAQILNFAGGSGATKAIQQHELALSSKGVQFNGYRSEYIQVLTVLNRKLSETYTEETGVVPFPIPEIVERIARNLEG